MSSLVIPNVFANGTVINSSPFNANFGAIATWSTAIDNTNIGPAGLFPNQLLPTTGAQATFGATATGVGYKFLANDATATPLIVSGTSGQSADIFDVTLTSGGTKAFFVSSGGAGNFGPGNATTLGDVAISRTGAASGLLIFGGGTASATIDFAVTTAAMLTANTRFNSTGALVAGSGNANSGIAAGDLSASATTSNGAVWVGGSVDFGKMDYAQNNATAFSFKRTSGGYAAVFGGAYTNASDATLKMNVAPIADAISTAMALKPVSFDWKHDGSSSLGFLAQDVQTVLPVLVSTDNNGSMGVNYDGIIPVLVKAFQELNASFLAYTAAHP